MAFYGVERGGGGSWWSWGGGALWPLCHSMCVHSHHLLATNTHTTHKGMQTDTHTGSELLWTSAQSVCETRLLV